ncbi:MAG: DUF4124 domain-containing protein [Gammaproteobacteria bacterium HGW-Gammaproteobacteria-1]|jgi:chromosome segregation ATPase|nr:MAG: DUF4124 domain-containing protein [Gammaproteobacteria bacterium HGW-Gammaproteobacteria-1]
MILNALRLPALLLALTVALPGSAFGAIKCWTNKEGVRECGNVVPPEYAQQETRTVNERGVTIEVKERAKTAEELEAERATKEAEERRIVEEKKRLEEQASYDNMLLSTFTTEQELIASRDRATGAIDATIEITGATINTLNRKQDDLKKRAAALERAGSPLPTELKEDMASLEKQIQEKKDYIEYKKREKEQLLEKFDMDLKRFRELKGVRPR